MRISTLWTSFALLGSLSACGGVSMLHSDDAREELRDCRRVNDSDACLDVANRFELGDAADIDLDYAERFYTRACNTDPRDGCPDLARFALENESELDIHGVVDRLERSCRRYSIAGCDTLIYVLESEDSEAFDPEYAQAIRDRLCEDGFIDYCFNDTDNDGINDDVDACPEVPEDADGFEDEDGCPDEDNDADGIVDADDACPDTAEDLDGFEDEDGCPDEDNDADGIVDADDACPDEAEDVDGFEDEDGCPELDNDGDGLFDGLDQCPLEPEDYDGFEDDDGCPEEGSGLVTLTCEAIEIGDKVYFDTASDVIQERSYELLNQVAQVLTSVSYITLLEVAGHTDDRGDDDYNLDLSQRRADSVRNYLIDAGIDGARLNAVGYGETQPIAPNNTSAGRTENRRVGFEIREQASACE